MATAFSNGFDATAPRSLAKSMSPRMTTPTLYFCASPSGRGSWPSLAVLVFTNVAIHAVTVERCTEAHASPPHVGSTWVCHTDR